MLIFIGGLLIGLGIACLAVNWMFCQGIYVKVGKYSGWACQYPGKMPRLYGAKEIAEVNHYPEQGDRLFRIVETED